MRKILTLLVTSTALTAAVGMPAWSAMRAPADGGLWPSTALFEEGAQTMPIVLASDDDDDDRRWRVGSRRGHDDDDDDDDNDNDDDCEDDDDDCPGAARNPAPAGTVAPPQNGLFGNGAPPKVQMN